MYKNSFDSARLSCEKKKKSSHYPVGSVPKMIGKIKLFSLTRETL